MELQQATAADPVMQALLSSTIPHGWPKSKDDEPNALRKYSGTTGMNSHQSMVSYLEHSGLLFLTVGEKKC